MAKPKKKVAPPRKPAKSHDELPRHSDWQNPRVVQILDAASRCFARDGLANTTVQEIAVEANLTKSMIHYYFESKQVLILELQAFVHERYFRRVQQKLEALAAAAAPSEERLQGALWEVFDIIADKQFLRLQLELMAEAGRDPYMKNRMQLAQERARDFIEQGAEQVVNAEGGPQIRLPRAIAFLISSTLQGLRIQEFISGEEDLARNAYGLFIAMLTGAMNQARTRPELVADEDTEDGEDDAETVPPAADA
ncbi:MAG: TetR/AcrR family transcriptional regulator [Deltaproteobacteria bacterium]|nr:TetR/AcrR family transcriptional regulator [Deltaproteobacteria bacterium]